MGLRLLLGMALLIVSAVITTLLSRRGEYEYAAPVLMLGIIAFIVFGWMALAAARKPKLGEYRWVNKKVEMVKEPYPPLPDEYRLERIELTGETPLGSRKLSPEEIAAFKKNFAPMGPRLAAIGVVWFVCIVGRLYFIPVYEEM